MQTRGISTQALQSVGRREPPIPDYGDVIITHSNAIIEIPTTKWTIHFMGAGQTGLREWYDTELLQAGRPADTPLAKLLSGRYS